MSNLLLLLDISFVEGSLLVFVHVGCGNWASVVGRHVTDSLLVFAHVVCGHWASFVGRHVTDSCCFPRQLCGVGTRPYGASAYPLTLRQLECTFSCVLELGKCNRMIMLLNSAPIALTFLTNYVMFNY